MSFELPDPPRDEDAATRSPETSGRDASSAATVPLKVSVKTKELVRLGAAMENCTQAEFVTRAVDRFIEAHADELREGFAAAGKALGV